MDDEAYECPECLKKIPGAEMIAKQKKAEKKAKLKKRLITAGSAAAAVILLTGVTLLVKKLNTKPSDLYMKPVKEYIKGCVENDYDKFISAFPDYYQQFLSEQFAYVVMGSVPEDAEKIHTADMLYHDQYYRALTQKLGLDFNIDYSIIKEERYAPDKLMEYQEEYRSYNTEQLENAVFDDGYEITVSFTAKGNLGSNSISKENFQLFDIDGKWYMMSYIDFLEEPEEVNIENFRN